MSGTTVKLFNAGIVALSLVIAGCGDDDGPAPLAAKPCNQAVYDVMTDAYYWYKHVPDVDPDNYTSPATLLADIRYLPLDESFTYLTTVEAENAFLSNAEYVGFGFSLAYDQNGRLFVKESFDGGPAHTAGMRRGDQITAINGKSVASLSPEQLNAELGPNDEPGYEATFDITPATGDPVTVTVAKAEVTAPVVAHVTTNLGNPDPALADTTYIFFRSFVDPAYNALDEAFAKMKAAGDTKLVLDLRYNGGGLVDVAEHLGGLIAGTDHAGTVLAELDFNDRYESRNNTSHLIQLLENSVDVEDLVVITTQATASASEMIINGLKPHMNVTTVGSTTYGKPVGQSRFEFCNTEILRAVTFSVLNSEGTSDYYDGFAPDCKAIDDVLHPLGDTAEASLSEALYVLENPGAGCSTASSKAARILAKRQAMQPLGDPLVRDGQDVLKGGAR